MYVFDYMRDILRDQITRASRYQRVIEFNDVLLRFTTDELYGRYDHLGNRAEVINCYHVERMLDTYKAMKENK